MDRKELTQSRLREVVSYDPATGEFYWLTEARVGFKRSVVMHSVGDKAKTARRDGRGVIRIDGKLYLSSRLAWLYMHGAWPVYEADHINTDRTDDRIDNLRDLKGHANRQNRRFAIGNKESALPLGVYRNKAGRRHPWRAAIASGGKQHYLGAFLTIDEASAAYVSAKRRLHEGCTL